MSFWNTIVFFLLAICSCSGTHVTPGVKITSMYVESNIAARLARVVVTTKVKNHEKTSHETKFTFQLPNTAFISNFSMTIGNKTISGIVKEKAAANKIYEQSKQQGVSAAKIDHVKDVPNRGMKVFSVSVNTAAQSKATFRLQYHELLQKKLGKFKQRIILKPQQVVSDLVFKAKIYEQEGIEEFQYTLPDSNVSESSSSEYALLKASDISRELYFKPSAQYQAELDPVRGLSGEIVLSYDVIHDNNGGIILKEKDYFVHYLSPQGFTVLAKNIIFVIDISGSMSGLKMEQTRNAMLVILDQLRIGDYFNILLFDDTIETWYSEPMPANNNNIRKAKSFVQNKVHARGGTNINTALLKSMSLLDMTQGLGGVRGNIIIFLTDGRPTSGTTDTKRIRLELSEANNHGFCLYSLGFGFDVDMPFLKALSWENNGFARRIYAETDASQQLQDFYKELENPTLLDVNIIYDGNEIEMMSLTQTRFPQYFEGTELIVAGKLNDPIRQGWTANVRGRGLTNDLNINVRPTSLMVNNNYTEFSVMEKLWAYLKINDLLKEAAIESDLKTKEMLENKILSLSFKYNFVTPLTSMVVTEIRPQTDLESDNYDESSGFGHKFGRKGILLSQNRSGYDKIEQNSILIFLLILTSLCYVYVE